MLVLDHWFGHAGTLENEERSLGSLAPQPSPAGRRLTVRESTWTRFVLSSRKAPVICTAHASRLVARAPAKITRPPCGGKTSATSSPSASDVTVPSGPS